MTALRKRLHSIIDEFPDGKGLEELESLLIERLEENENYWEPVIERVTCSKEIAEIDKRANEFKTDPSSFIPLSEIMKRREVER